jgi:group II intron reverse transcriptase/maturase
MILEAYYEPQFSTHSHGFRPGRGCHTALDEIRRQWKGVKWFIEGDIKGCFDNLDHQLILDLIGRKIPDQRFLKLLKDMLKAGYVEDWQYYQTYSGTPQGGVISPVISNIVLNELDQYVEKELLPSYNRGNRRKLNPVYRALWEEMIEAKAAGDVQRYQELRQKRRQIPSIDPNDEQFRRLYYIRYADDFLLGFAGPKAEAIEIKEKIGQALKRLKLQMSEAKTLITHAESGRARFLGYELTARRNNTRLSQGRDGIKRRSINSNIKLYVPRDVANEWQRRYTRYGKPIHRTELLNNSDYEIVNLYNAEFQGLANYYSLALDVSKRLYPVKYTFMQSLVKTLACKHKCKATSIYRQYKTKFETGVTGLMVTVRRDEPKSPLVAKFGAKPIRTIKNAVLTDKKPLLFSSDNEIVRRLLAGECELCQSKEDIEVHHVRKVSDVRKRYRGRKKPPDWAVFMMKRNRKTVVVCRKCHRNIHQGKYDGQKLA